MYTWDQRDVLCQEIVEFMKREPDFEGLLQIGSGVVGYRDIYSDIDLMSGCWDEESVMAANGKLNAFFEGKGAVYINRRRWSRVVLGMSVYFENGLSADISFMPTNAVQLRNKECKVLFSKSERFSIQIAEDIKKLEELPKLYGVDDTIHHQFVYALRRCEIAVLRGEYIYAEMALSEARRYLLYVEAVLEGKKLHQFKQFQSLKENFREELQKTYPANLNQKSMEQCEKYLLEMYLKTIEKCDFLKFDSVQRKLLNCFREN